MQKVWLRTRSCWACWAAKRLPTLSFLLVLHTVFVCSCTPRPAAHVRALIEATKQQAKPDELRQLLLPFFYYDGPRYADDTVSVTNALPRQILALPLFAEEPVFVQVDRVDRGNVLVLTTGSGFGHWGIVVLRPGYEESFDDSIYTAWGRGVYFYNEYK